MSLLASLAAELGISITKSIIKICFKDADSAIDASSTVIDTVKVWAGENSTRKQALKRCEEMGKTIASDVLARVNLEGANPNEVNPAAVVRSAAETLATLTSKLVVQENLNPGAVACHLLAHPVGTTGFSEAEQAYFRQIITVACIDIIKDSSQLQTFTEAAFAELLARDATLLSVAQRSAEGVYTLVKRTDPDDKMRQFEQEYRDAVVNKLDSLQLFGVDSPTARHGQCLSIAYVTLSMEQKRSRDTELHQGIAQFVDVPGLQRDNEARVVLSTEMALKDAHRLLIRGEAGSGKTTLLQWIAVNAVQRTFVGPLAVWNQLIPFYIRLRDHEEPKRLTLKDFPLHVTHATLEDIPDGWVQQALRAGRAMLLVDGLDEVAAEKRGDVYNWLKDLVKTYPQTILLVTSRPNAIEEGWLDPEGFRDANLQKMSLSDIHTFIDHWHTAVERQPSVSYKQLEIKKHAQELKREIELHTSIRELATSPLLCAMLCTLNWDRHGYIPRNRIELYDACCAMLIERRDKERGINLKGYPAAGLDMRIKITFIAELAYWMTRNNHIQLQREQVEASFARTRQKTLGVQSHITSVDIYNFFVHRTSIIREPILEHVDFAHRTFQEYLAAKAAIEEEDIGVLIEHADNDQWTELIALAAGIASLKRREQLIYGILQRGDREFDHKYELYLLAFRCLTTSSTLSPETRQELANRIDVLIPPRNEADAQVVGAIGESAIPHLAKKPGYNEDQMVTCIQALAATGCESALDEIEKYTSEKNSKVINALSSVWSVFDTRKYAQRIIAPLSEVRLEYLNSVDKISYLSHIMTLCLNNCRELRDLSVLASLTQLTSLTLGRCEQLRDLSVLASLTQLTSLSLLICEDLTDLSALASLKKLNVLILIGCEQLRDLSALASLTQLDFLMMFGCTQVRDLSALSALSQLSMLNLHGCTQVRDLSPLSALSQLSTLDLSGCTQLSDLSALSALTQLLMLDLSGCTQLSDFSFLENKKKLRIIRG